MMSTMAANRLKGRLEDWKHLHLGHAPKRQRWRETTGKSVFYSTDKKVYLFRLNRPGYRGINHRLLSWIRLSVSYRCKEEV